VVIVPIRPIASQNSQFIPENRKKKHGKNGTKIAEAKKECHVIFISKESGDRNWGFLEQLASVASSILQYIQKNMKKNPCFQKESDLQMILPSGYVKMDLSISFLYVYQRYQRVNGGFGILTLTSPIFWPCMGVIYLPQTHTY